MVNIENETNYISNNIGSAGRGVSSALNSTSATLAGVSEGISAARDATFNAAESIGIKPFLSKNDTNRERSTAVESLLNTIDQSIQRSYIGDGFADVGKTKPNIRNIITQTPDCIVLVKKKMFGSLADNFDPKYMDKDELHFYRASKKLFENKCTEISNYEKLTKIEKLVDGNGVITTAIAQAIYDVISIYDETDFNRSALEDDYLSFPRDQFVIPKKELEYIKKNRDAAKKIKHALTLNGFSNITSWVKDTKTEQKTPLGVGTGVIELTLVKSFSATTGVDFGSGSCNLEVSDPYNLLFIDEVDIERAIYETSYQKLSITSYLARTLETETDDLKQQVSVIRTSRGASDLSYKIDLYSTIYNNFIITTDSGYELTSPVDGKLDFDSIKNTTLDRKEWFTQEEKNLLNRIYKNTFKIIKFKNQNYQDYRNYNKVSNYVRKLMRIYYLGKHIIQPMDEVRIFVDSKTVEDVELNVFSNNYNDLFEGGVTGLLGGRSIFGGVANVLGSTNMAGLLNKTMGQIKQLTGETYNKNILEKNLIVGKDFPIWLWNMLRPNFVSNSFGTCVFCGVVDSVRESSSAENVYSLSVACKDNTFYLSQGFLPSKPSLDQYNGHILDPLSPYKNEFNKATGFPNSVADFELLDENKRLLTTGEIKIQDGKNKGLPANLVNFNDPDYDSSKAISQVNEAYSDLVTKVYSSPDGFVYRWKRGIGSASISQTGTYDGIIARKLMSDDFGLVPVNADNMPFAGQDFINIVSILICGEPYNFNTFYKAASQYANISTDSSSFTDVDYYQSIFRRVKKLNKFWGNFVPFKKFTVDPKTFGLILQMQSTTLTQSMAIKQKQKKKTQLLNKLIKVEGSFFDYDKMYYLNADLNPNAQAETIYSQEASITSGLIKNIVMLDAEIQLHEQMIRESFQQSDTVKKQIISVGNNIYYNNEAGLNFDTSASYKLKQQEQNELTKRRLWQCKGNTDQNLFIVGSEYDLDYDIQALMTNLNSDFDIFSSSWLNVGEKVRNICSMVGFECFANTQGHIEFRVPKYNRVPSSILFDMLKKKQQYGIQIYPEFLEETFQNQAEVLISKLEILEDEIRLRAFALGGKAGNDDSYFSELLNGALINDASSDNSRFVFVTNQNGDLADMKKLLRNINVQKEESKSWSPVSIDDDTADFFSRNSDSGAVTNLLKASKSVNNFDIFKQRDNFSNAYRAKNYVVPNNFTSDFASSTIRTRLAAKKNVNIDSIPSFNSLMPNSLNGKKSPLDINNVQNQLEQLVKQRYEVILQLVNVIKNVDSANRINSSDNELLSKLLFPNLYGTENIPDFLVDMIEDETVDDFGPGSGRRYVIRERDIKSMTYSQYNPDMTSIEISGSESGLEGVDIDFGSNAKFTQVTSVDFDMWRMFGYKAQSGKNYPFLSDVKTQLAPYALYLLNKERAEILQANVTIRGNEFIQPGEVYYLEKRGMLFYCKSVTHQFDYSGNFTTTMTLVMGHVPGEYIPTPLDVIGKNVYNSNTLNVGKVKVCRGSTVDSSQVNLGIVGIINSGIDIYDGNLGDRNKETITNIAGKVLYLLNKPIVSNSSTYQGITVRVYSDDSVLNAAAKSVIKELIKIGVPKSRIIGYNGTKYVVGEPMMVNLVDSKTKDVRNPSSDAHSVAGVCLDNGYVTGTNKLDVIKNYIIDIWLEDNILLTPELEAQIVEKQKSSTKEDGKETRKQSVFDKMYQEYQKYKKEQFSNAVTVTSKKNDADDFRQYNDVISEFLSSNGSNE